jgi:phosphoribosylanthranilate isomerase
MFVKICGLNDAASLRVAAEAGANAIGFVFFPPSPRAVTPARAAAILAEAGPLPPALRKVGLFVDPSLDAIDAALRAVPLDTVQIHGIRPDRAALRARGLTIWHATGVSSAADLPASCGGADALLLDAKPPRGATRPGGNAIAIDWTLPLAWHAPCPWILAGGLTPENVLEAIQASGAIAVDVSSGVEQRLGQKDPDRIRRFIAAARGG